jgi:hypothetical protein
MTTILLGIVIVLGFWLFDLEARHNKQEERLDLLEKRTKVLEEFE